MLVHSLQPTCPGAYFQQLVVSITEALDFTSWNQAWQKLVERHEVLRIHFDLEDHDRPVQKVLSHDSGAFVEHDWRGLPVGDRGEQFAAFLKADRLHGFDFSQSPPWRWNLFRLTENDSRLVWSSHHALFDGRTRRLLIEELFSLYDASLEGLEIDLEEPPPIGDYLRWATTRDDSWAQGHWVELLQGFSKATPLPERDSAKPILDGEASHQTVELSIPASLTENLEKFAKGNDITFNTMLQGAWALLLGVYSGMEDVVFGATRSCRHAPSGVGATAGLLINTLPVRVGLPERAELGEWLRELRSQWVKLRDFENTSLATIHHWSEIAGGEPLFESIVVFEKDRLEEAVCKRNPAWRSRHLRLHGTTHYPLVVAGYGGNSLSVEITFDRRRFDEDTIARMLGHLHTALESMVQNPRQRLGEFSLISSLEKEKIVNGWNQTAVPYPQTSIARLFEDQVARRPAEIALISGDRQWTYDELNGLSNHLAHRLRDLGVDHGTPVAICGERSPELIVGLLATLKVGGVYIPIAPEYPRARIDLILEDTAAHILLCQCDRGEELSSSGVPCIWLDIDDEAGEHSSKSNPDCPATPDSRAYIIYTSGSTGVPKGVVVSHRAVISLVSDAGYARLDAGQRIGCAASISFDAATFEIWGALLRGGTCVLVPGRFSTLDSLEDALIGHQVDTLFLTTALFNAVIDEKPAILCGIRQLLFGGEAHSSGHVSRACKALPETTIIHVYGPTEATTFSTFYRIPHGKWTEEDRIPIGKPIANTTVYLTDRLGRLVPPGVSGEILVGGPRIAEGYLNQAELTKKCYVPDRFSEIPGARLFRTGDRARYLPDGNLVFLGRLDDQVKIRGYRIEPAEIALALQQHPDVFQAAVIARDTLQGVGLRLIAYVVSGLPRGGASTSALQRFLGARLPEQMIPPNFVFLDELPLSPNGKVNRGLLPDPEVGGLAETHELPSLPQTYLERQILDILRVLLQREEVGLQDEFFELGVDSLVAMRALARLHDHTGINLLISEFFRLGTVSRVAARLESMMG